MRIKRLWGVEDLVHYTARNCRLRVFSQPAFLFLAMMIPGILTQQQSHIVRYFFINSQSREQGSLKARASLCSPIARFAPA